MKVSKNYLKQIIKEELEKLELEENLEEGWKQKIAGGLAGLALMAGAGSNAQAAQSGQSGDLGKVTVGPGQVTSVANENGWADISDIEKAGLKDQYMKIFRGYMRLATPGLEADMRAREDLKKQGYDVKQVNINVEDTRAYKIAHTNAIRLGAKPEKANTIALNAALDAYSK